MENILADYIESLSIKEPTKRSYLCHLRSFIKKSKHKGVENIEVLLNEQDLFEETLAELSSEEAKRVCRNFQTWFINRATSITTEICSNMDFDTKTLLCTMYNGNSLLFKSGDKRLKELENELGRITEEEKFWFYLGWFYQNR